MAIDTDPGLVLSCWMMCTVSAMRYRYMTVLIGAGSFTIVYTVKTYPCRAVISLSPSPQVSNNPPATGPKFSGTCCCQGPQVIAQMFVNERYRSVMQDTAAYLMPSY